MSSQKSYTDRIKALVSRPPGAGPPTPTRPAAPAPRDTARETASKPPSGPIVFSTTKLKKDRPKHKIGARAILRGRRSLPANDWRVIALTVASVALATLSLVLVWILAVIRPKMQAHIAQQQSQLEVEAQKTKDLQASLEAKEQELIRAHSAVGTLRITTEPAGAMVTFAGRSALSPTNLEAITLGTYTLTVQLEGYADFSETIALTNDVPVGRSVQLIPSTGQLLIESEPTGAFFTIKHKGQVAQTGQAPIMIKDLRVGEYTLVLKKGEAEHIENIQIAHGQTKEIHFRFRLGRLRVESDPPGAGVTIKGHTIGKTPLLLTEVPEGPVELELRLHKFLPKRLTAQVASDQEALVSDRLEPNLGPPRGKDFTSSVGLDMVWVSPGFWVSRHEVTQAQYITVMGSEPSSMKGPLRPVDSVTWNQAVAFCDRLTQAEDAAESLPAGFRFTLPTETEWLGFAGPPQASGVAVLGSAIGTTDVTRTPANGLGLRGVWGNVWEWCLDSSGNGRVLRGGGWTPIYDGLKQITDRTVAPDSETNPSFGFRVILKPTRK